MTYQPSEYSCMYQQCLIDYYFPRPLLPSVGHRTAHSSRGGTRCFAAPSLPLARPCCGCSSLRDAPKNSRYYRTPRWVSLAGWLAGLRALPPAARLATPPPPSRFHATLLWAGGRAPETDADARQAPPPSPPSGVFRAFRYYSGAIIRGRGREGAPRRSLNPFPPSSFLTVGAAAARLPKDPLKRDWTLRVPPTELSFRSGMEVPKSVALVAALAFVVLGALATRWLQRMEERNEEVRRLALLAAAEVEAIEKEAAAYHYGQYGGFVRASDLPEVPSLWTTAQEVAAAPLWTTQAQEVAPVLAPKEVEAEAAVAVSATAGKRV
ncbi:uncharacterized protein LOC110432751, partial [Sorghum bicolor]|uniref:uncharacterized protein LOC110432751 n=1 Tax=Sorghum bicolor TaxID=4558 RepID=UPI000B4254A0